MDAAATTTNEVPPPRKTSKGRQKIEIKKVEKESRRYVTFSKRKQGILKKGTELYKLCGGEIAIILFSEHGKVFCCGYPDVDSVIDRYLEETNKKMKKNENYSSSLLAESISTSAPWTSQEQAYNESVERLGEMQRVAKMIETNSDEVINNGEFWWNLPIDNIEREELEDYKESLEELMKNVVGRIELMADNNAKNESGIISQFINQNGGCWSSEFFNSNVNKGGFM